MDVVRSMRVRLLEVLASLVLQVFLVREQHVLTQIGVVVSVFVQPLHVVVPCDLILPLAAFHLARWRDMILGRVDVQGLHVCVDVVLEGLSLLLIILALQVIELLLEVPALAFEVACRWLALNHF